MICLMMVSFARKKRGSNTDAPTGALSAGRLERIIIDASHIDSKKRGILDMKDTESPLIKLLTRPSFKEKYNEDKMKKIELIFY